MISVLLQLLGWLAGLIVGYFIIAFGFIGHASTADLSGGLLPIDETEAVGSSDIAKQTLAGLIRVFLLSWTVFGLYWWLDYDLLLGLSIVGIIVLIFRWGQGVQKVKNRFRAYLPGQ